MDFCDSVELRNCGKVTAESYGGIIAVRRIRDGRRAVGPEDGRLRRTSTVEWDQDIGTGLHISRRPRLPRPPPIRRRAKSTGEGFLRGDDRRADFTYDKSANTCACACMCAEMGNRPWKRLQEIEFIEIFDRGAGTLRGKVQGWPRCRQF